MSFDPHANMSIDNDRDDVSNETGFVEVMHVHPVNTKQCQHLDGTYCWNDTHILQATEAVYDGMSVNMATKKRVRRRYPRSGEPQGCFHNVVSPMSSQCWHEHVHAVDMRTSAQCHAVMKGKHLLADGIPMSPRVRISML
jgi:hypothetical protein